MTAVLAFTLAGTLCVLNVVTGLVAIACAAVGVSWLRQP